MDDTPVINAGVHHRPKLTPKRLLLMFCMINMLNNADQGAIASNGVNGSLKVCSEDGFCTSQSGIQGDFNLNNFDDGVLSSAFIVGLLVASPIFASLAKRHNPFRLIGIGLSFWTFAIAGCGFSFNFWSIALCRMLVGFGEASFVSLAAPFIDDYAPAAQKNAWLAMFYMCIPTGTALGYVYGGLVGNLNWRYAFWGEAISMLPFVVLSFVAEPLQLKGLVDSDFEEALSFEDTAFHVKTADQVVSCDASTTVSEVKGSLHISSQLNRLLKDVLELLSEEVYAVNLLGSIFYNFVLGAYSYWGPKTGYNMYHMTNPDMLFGVITIVCGIVGTLSGGYVLDCMNNTTISNAFKILSGAALLGATFCFSAFCFRSLNVFVMLFVIGELFVFATQAPVYYVFLHSVEPSLRPMSMAISTVLIHIFGDVPSSPLVGVLQDYVDNWRKTALILTSILFLASGTWFIGVFLNGVDRYDDNKIFALEIKEDHAQPLLDDNTNV